MREEMVLTEQDLQTRFFEERDLITYSLYQVGDRVVRCATCRAVVKSEYVSDACPLCGHSPFLPTRVENVPAVQPTGHTTVSPEQSFSDFLILLLISSFLSLAPFLFPEASEFLYEAAFYIGDGVTIAIAWLISILSVLILYFSQKSRQIWQTSSWGYLLPFFPIVAPYISLLAIYAFVAVMAAIIAVGCIAIIIGIINN